MGATKRKRETEAPLSVSPPRPKRLALCPKKPHEYVLVFLVKIGALIHFEPGGTSAPPPATPLMSWKHLSIPTEAVHQQLRQYPTPYHPTQPLPPPAHLQHQATPIPPTAPLPFIPQQQHVFHPQQQPPVMYYGTLPHGRQAGPPYLPPTYVHPFQGFSLAPQMQSWQPAPIPMCYSAPQPRVIPLAKETRSRSMSKVVAPLMCDALAYCSFRIAQRSMARCRILNGGRRRLNKLLSTLTKYLEGLYEEFYFTRF